MPYSPVGAIPFAGGEGGTDRILQLMMEQGRARANATAQRGANLGNMIAGIGQTVGQGIDAYQVNKAAEKKAAFEAQQTKLLGDEFGNPDGPNWNRVTMIVGPERAQKLQAGAETLKATAIKSQGELEGLARTKADAILAAPEPMRAQLYGISRDNLLRLGVPAEAFPETYDEGFVRSQATPPKQGEGFNLSPGMVRFGPDGKQIAAVPEAAKAPGTHVVGGNLVDDAGKVLFTAPKEAAGEGKGVWVTRGGQPLHIPESQIQPGDTPYESARTGMKKIPAGSAEKLGAYQSGLASVDDIGKALSGNNATGPLAWAESKIPSSVTAVTGWGTDAKSKQANIALVKQIIGKTLEGGVLRKEDEEKYKDILPLIGDAGDVVKNKLIGLRRAIRNKNTADVDALEDAGYDMAQFREREAAKTPEAKTVEDLRKQYGY